MPKHRRAKRWAAHDMKQVQPQCVVVFTRSIYNIVFSYHVGSQIADRRGGAPSCCGWLTCAGMSRSLLGATGAFLHPTCQWVHSGAEPGGCRLHPWFELPAARNSDGSARRTFAAPQEARTASSYAARRPSHGHPHFRVFWQPSQLAISTSQPGQLQRVRRLVSPPRSQLERPSFIPSDRMQVSPETAAPTGRSPLSL